MVHCFKHGQTAPKPKKIAANLLTRNAIVPKLILQQLVPILWGRYLSNGALPYFILLFFA